MDSSAVTSAETPTSSCGTVNLGYSSNGDPPMLPITNGSNNEEKNIGKTAQSEEHTLKQTVMLDRKVGLPSGVGLIIGVMIGSGIFVSPQGVLSHTGSVGLSLIIWAVSGLISMIGALCYTEMTTIMPFSGGEFTYFLRTFAPLKKSDEKDGKPVGNRGYGRTVQGFLRPLPAFIVCWVYTFIGAPTSLAIICLTFSQYFQRVFLIGCSVYISEERAEKLIAACAILLITFVNVYSVEIATRVQNVFSFAKLLSMTIIIGGGIAGIARGNTETLATGFDGTTSSPGQIALAVYSGFWAFAGWNTLNEVAGEVRNPSVTLPRAILIALPLVTVCYILVNVSYLTAMTKEELLAADTVAVLFGSRVMGVAGEVLMIVSVVLSTFGAANGSAFSGGRLIYAAAIEGHTVEMLSYVHVKRRTPAVGIIFNSIVAILMLIFDISSLIGFFGFTSWLYYGGVMVCLLVLRKTEPDISRPLKVPIILPILMLGAAIYFLVAPIVDSPQMEYVYVLLFIAFGVVLYVPFVFFRWSLPLMKHINWFVQVICEAVPPEDFPDP